MSKINWDQWDNTSESGFGGIEKGAYICEIKAVHDEEDRQLLTIEWDIVDPKYKDYYEGRRNDDGSWAYDARLFRSYKATAYSFLKGFVTALEKSNPGYNFRQTNGDFAKWVGLKFVGVFGEKEIPVADENGNPVVTVRRRGVRSIDALQRGDIKIPDDIEKLDDYGIKTFNEKYNSNRVASAEESQQIIDEHRAATQPQVPVDPDNLPF